MPVRLAQALIEKGCDVAAFPNAWKGLTNGRLLEQISTAGFGCVLTCDKNLRHQQNLGRRNLAFVILPGTRFEDLHPILDHIANGIEKVESGQVVVLSPDGKYAIY